MASLANKSVPNYLYSLCCFVMFAVAISCSHSSKEPLPTPPSLSINPGLSLTIPYNTSATFSWSTNGTYVTVNGIDQTSTSFTTPLLKSSSTFTVTAYPSNLAGGGLSTTMQVEVKVLPNDPVNVYCAGADNGRVVYWKDSTEHLVATYPLWGQNRPSGIAVQGSDIYVVGYARDIAAYWKNGVEFLLSSGQGHSAATEILISGSDVYICGSDRTSTGFHRAVYWKNGVRVVLESARALETASVEGIAVSGGNVYTVGHIQDTAILWTNGVRTVLGGISVVVCGVAVSGNDVYVIGRDYQTPVYWKNGIRTTLPSIGIGTPLGITFSGSDVYIAGHDGANAVYWKNGMKTLLSTSNSYASSITTFNGDVYIGGIVSGEAVYWKDGVKTTLPSFEAPTGFGMENHAIAVMKR